MNRTCPIVIGVWALLGIACEDPSEVVIFIDTSLPVPCIVDSVKVTIDDGASTIERRAALSDGLVSLTVVREGSGSAFSVAVEGLKDEQVVATANAEANFEDETRLALPIVLSSNCQDTPCNATDRLTREFQVPIAEARSSCNGISDSYQVSTTSFVQSVNACETASTNSESLSPFEENGEEKSLDNESLSDMILSEDFQFRFYGQQVQNLWIADDGFISFGAEPTGKLNRDSSADSIIRGGAPRFGVLAFYDDLQLRALTSDVCVSLLGQTGQRKLWITWNDVCFAPACADEDHLTFSIALEEGTNRIIISFDIMESGNNPGRARGNRAIVGISGPDLGSEQEACPTESCSSEGICALDDAPCGYTQFLARVPQAEDAWPIVLEFTPNIGN